MNTRTRNFMIGSAVVLMVGLGAGLVAYYGGLPGIAARHAGPAELEYLPANAAVVAYANVGDVMRSDFRQRMRAVIPDADKDKGRKGFEEATGIDIERDIEGVMAALVAGQEDKMPIVAIRGRFDQGRLEALAREHGATVEVVDGIRFIQMPTDRQNTESQAEGESEEPTHRRHGRHDFKGRPSMAFVEPGLMLFGDVDAVRAAVQHKRDGQNLTSNSELMSRIARLESQSSNAWALGRVDSLAQRAELPEEMALKIPAITWFEASGHVNGGLNGVLRAETRDEEAARNLRDMLNGFMAFGRLQSQSNPQVQALMQSVTLGGSGKTIELSFTVPVELLDLMAPKAKANTIAAR